MIVRVEEKRKINNFTELLENSWGGGYGTLKQVEKKCRQYELMNLLEERFSGYREPPTDIEVNNFLWYELTKREEWENLFDEEEW